MFKFSCFFGQLLSFLVFSTPTIAQEQIVQKTESTVKSSLVDVPLLRAKDADSYKLTKGSHEFNFEIGYSPFEPTHFAGPKEYNTAGRKLGVVNFRLGRVIGSKKGVTYTYSFGFLPVIIALKNEVKNKDYVSLTATPNISPTKRETSHGFGVTPLNFRFIFGAEKRIKPYAQVGAGVLLFNKPLPIPESLNLQFTGDFGGGLMINRSSNKAWFFGYKYFHISNGDRTIKKYNPGFNANVFYIGYSFFK